MTAVLMTSLRATRNFILETLGASSSKDGLKEPPLGATILIASAVVNILALALPLAILQIYDRVLPNAAFNTLTALVLALVAVIAIDGVLKYLRAYVANWAAASFTHKLSTKALSTMLASPPAQFNRVTTSEHLERLGAISGLGNHLGGQSRLVAIDLLFIPVFAAVIILVGGSLILVMLALFAVFGSLAMGRAEKLNTYVAEREKMESRKNDFFIEVLSAIQTVKAHAMEPLIMRRFERLQSSASVVTKRLIEQTGHAQTQNAMYMALSVVGIVGIGALLVFNGRLTLGALACCMLLSSQLLQPLMRSLSAWNELQLARHRRQRVQAIFEETGQGPVKTPAKAVAAAKMEAASISFDDVTIKFGDAAPLFQNVTIDIPKGALIAITGADGSGRTSLLRAIMGDITPASGDILIDGVSVASAVDANPAARARFVGSTPTLFRGTVLDNLTLFGALPTDAALSAAHLIGLHDEIIRMPMGYDTLLKSAAGRDIPIAAAQQICIARAIATTPPVLIFDESNSLLDMRADRRFGEALQQLKGAQTIVIATHRPSLIRMADAAYDIVDASLFPLSTSNTPDARAS